MKRHIGKITNTDQRCVIVMMQIPGREDHALILPIDNLPARYEQAVMSLLESPEGQAEEVFYAILDRRLMPDTGKRVLLILHENGLLHAIPCNNITMMPLPNMPFPLVALLQQMGRSIPNQPPSDPSVAEMHKYNQHNVNREVGQVQHNTGIANNLLWEADDLERTARRKREQAYVFNPALRPQPVTQPVNAAQLDLPLGVSTLPELSETPAVDATTHQIADIADAFRHSTSAE